MISPTHVVALFDCETHNVRCDILEEYKANRIDYSTVAEEENPFTVLPEIYEALDIMGIKHTEIRDAEVDDAIASYALTKDDDTEIFISSFDSDYFQLLRDDVKLIRYRGRSTVIIDREYLKEKLGIEPGLYAEHKSLVGDSADNIKGVRGIGPKTATALLNDFGSLEAIYASLELVKNDRIRASLSESKDTVFKNLSLIKLDLRAAIPFPTDELKCPAKRLRTMETVYSINGTYQRTTH
jgi:DNA polymerase-1